MKTLYTFGLALFIHSIYAQPVTVQSGPMNGYANLQEAVVWVQLTGAAEVFAEAQLLNATESEIIRSNTIQTQAENAYTAKLYFHGLKAGNTYNYRIVINGEAVSFDYPTQISVPAQWSYRTDPPEINVAMGSCAYINEKPYDRPGKSYGGGYEIYKSIYSSKPDLMLWLGDNNYLRAGEWWTKRGIQHRYTHSRSLPEMQPLLATGHHVNIWDDHDYGPNNANGSWVTKDIVLETFKDFTLNYSYGYDDLPGIMSAYRYGDIDFIITDNRYHRTEQYNDPEEEHIFGKKQSKRLIEMLKFSRAPFKIVLTGGQFVNSAKVYENHANYELERQYILDLIAEEDIKGVIFINGDRHHSEVSKLSLPNGKTVHEFTVSPMNSGANDNVTETNDNRVKGSLIQQRNYAVLNVKGGFRDRVLTLTYYDVEGKELFQFTLDSDEIYK